MTDIRRTVLLVAFTMSLLMLWDRWHVFKGEPSMFAPHPAQLAATAPKAAASAALAASGAVPGGAAAGVASAASAPELAPEPVTVTTDVYKATLNTRGGDLVDLDLLKYPQNDSHSELLLMAKKAIGLHVEPPPEGNVQVFDTHGDDVYVAQTGLSGEAGHALPTHRTVMRLASGERSLAPGKDELVLRFESPEVDGVQLVKTYTFHRGSYAVGVSHEVVNHGTAPVSPQLYLQLVRDGRVPPGGYFSGPSSYTGPAVYRDGKFSKVSFETIDKDKQKDTVDPASSATDGWVAMTQHYFASAWILPQGTARTFSLGKLPADANATPTYRVGMLTPLGPIAPGASKRVDATLFAGPQEEHLLEPIAPGLEQVKDYGVFKIIAQPLFWLLAKLHTLIGNWGWSIVALVVVIKIAFYGLNASAYRSMAKMKVVGPRLQELRVRYKDNPQQLQAETMKIYKEEKVNPLGGCLPILVQMPIFFALLSVLTSAAEMRGAPWILWVHDLSVMDPYGILPVLMTLSSLAQVALQPTPTDPTQAKLMWMMPIAFSIALFAFPSGLVLYWLSNNLLTIAQQWLINRQINAGRDTKASVTDAKVVKK